ncbi:MAG: nuclear transport factor 2 family protein [Chitinophagaceae bacterium]|nr:nuclear transport factor 2 family protein [Chitinophagaceae bacterium]
MKKIQIAVLIISLSTALHAQTRVTENQLAVQQTVIKAFDALSNRDSVSLKLFCADDIALYEYGQVWNIDTLINKAIRLNTSADFNRTNTLDFISTTVNKNTAWTTYHLNSEIIKDGKHISIQWLETVVLVKEKKRWKIKVLHSSLIKRS